MMAAAPSSSSSLSSFASLPSIIYGTAWKKNQTESLVSLALKAGFRAIDTASQPKHYNEAGVGAALSSFSRYNSHRSEFFIQSKFTSIDGQDTSKALPYQINAPVNEQVLQSFSVSLKNLHTDYLDSYLLHGPYSSGERLVKEDWLVWDSLSKLFEEGKVKRIGISNVNIHQLKELFENAKIRPSVVQNRVYGGRRGWDGEVRHFCSVNNICYEGFSLLTANPQIVQSSLVKQLSQSYGKTNEQIILRFSQQIGIVPLSGTTNENHMRDDLSITSFSLNEQEIQKILLLK